MENFYTKYNGIQSIDNVNDIEKIANILLIMKEISLLFSSFKNEFNNDIEKITPLKKTLENLTFAEDLMESLDSAEKFRKDVYHYEINLEEYTVNK